MNLECLAVDVVVLVVVAGAELGVPGGAVAGADTADGCGVIGGASTLVMSASLSGRLMVPVVTMRLRSMTIA